MSKRQPGRAKVDNEWYPTPAAAVLPLLPHLPKGVTFYEPCAGDGALIDHLASAGRYCVGACDIAPRDRRIARGDCLMLHENDVQDAALNITNPPHSHELLAPIIEHLRKLRPTWLLLPLDWCGTLQAKPHLAYCSDIVCIGRMKIFKGSKTSGYDNYVWARFQDVPTKTVFHRKEMRNALPAPRRPRKAAAE